MAFFDFSCFSSATRLDTGIRSRLRSGPDCATTCQDQPRITSGVGLSLLELAGKLEPAGRLEFAGVPSQFRGAVDDDQLSQRRNGAPACNDLCSGSVWS